MCLLCLLKCRRDLLSKRSHEKHSYNFFFFFFRYVTFRQSTFSALEQLGQHFIYNFVQAMGSFTEVERNIKREMDYQSCLEVLYCRVSSWRILFGGGAECGQGMWPGHGHVCSSFFASSSFDHCFSVAFDRP